MIVFNNIVGWSVHCSVNVRVLAGLLLIVVSVGHQGCRMLFAISDGCFPLFVSVFNDGDTNLMTSGIV